MLALNKKNRQPLYYQLKRRIEERIESGEWKPGAQLPSERVFCDELGISRITVRQALSELVSEGRLYREHGRGTYVASVHIEQGLNRLTGFSEDIRAQHQRPASRVLELQLTTASDRIARALVLHPAEPVILLKRLRLADGEPMAVETAWLVDRLCHDLIHRKIGNQSLYKLLRERFEIMPAFAEQQLKAIPCPGAEADLLGVRKGSPVLHIYRTTFDQANIPFEHVESIYRGDKYVFNVRLNHV